MNFRAASYEKKKKKRAKQGKEIKKTSAEVCLETGNND